jgi:hypothetical protein
MVNTAEGRTYSTSDLTCRRIRQRTYIEMNKRRAFVYRLSALLERSRTTQITMATSIIGVGQNLQAFARLVTGVALRKKVLYRRS